MTGREHYVEAERLLAEAETQRAALRDGVDGMGVDEIDSVRRVIDALVCYAQCHATLAVAAGMVGAAS